MNDKVKQVLNVILDKFKSGDIPEAVAYAIYPIPEIPSAKWSLTNRTLMFLSGTMDGRGYKQWQQVDRYVKKSSKAFFILVPFFKKVEGEQGGKKDLLVGFGCRPVFRVEDTDGKSVEYENMELPDLPLLVRAEEWGINVRAIPGNYRYFGYYSLDRKEIHLATSEEIVFFHELSHVAHEKVNGSLKRGQDPIQEIVAELSAAALCKLVGKQGNGRFGNSYRYIEKYSEKIKMSPYNACLKVMSETEKVLNLILNGENEMTFHHNPTT